MKQYFAEMFGTFTLVFAGTGALAADRLSGGAVTHVGVSLAFGLAVMTMIYAVGDVSGAHLNPAVTLGFWRAGRFPLRQVPGYIVFQLAGALLASVALRSIFGPAADAGQSLPTGGVLASLILEAILTALLMVVILSVSTGAKEKGIMAGAAIGAVIAMEALFAGPVCGRINESRALIRTGADRR